MPARSTSPAPLCAGAATPTGCSSRRRAASRTSPLAGRGPAGSRRSAASSAGGSCYVRHRTEIRYPPAVSIIGRIVGGLSRRHPTLRTQLLWAFSLVGAAPVLLLGFV